MSKQGSILRGEKYYLLNRDADGNLLPVISEDPNKMVDVNAYLKARDPEPKKEKK